MKNLLLALLLALPPFVLAAAMTNDDVIKMVKGGLSDAIVMQAIEGSEAGFDTSPDGLVKLKQGGVSDPVIQKILSKKGAAPVAAAPAVASAAAAPVAAKPAACAECGTITAIREVDKKGGASGLGAVAGGVVGGVLGRAVGGRDHRTAGTVVGAAGGAVAGHMIERQAKSGKTFEIGVKFDNGSAQVFTLDAHPSWKAGDRVKLVNGVLTSL